MSTLPKRMLERCARRKRAIDALFASQALARRRCTIAGAFEPDQGVPKGPPTVSPWHASPSVADGDAVAAPFASLPRSPGLRPPSSKSQTPWCLASWPTTRKGRQALQLSTRPPARPHSHLVASGRLARVCLRLPPRAFFPSSYMLLGVPSDQPRPRTRAAPAALYLIRLDAKCMSFVVRRYDSRRRRACSSKTRARRLGCDGDGGDAVVKAAASPRGEARAFAADLLAPLSRARRFCAARLQFLDWRVCAAVSAASGRRVLAAARRTPRSAVKKRICRERPP